MNKPHIQKLVLLLLYIPFILILFVSTLSSTAAQPLQEQQRYIFATQWAEGSNPGQFMGHNDVVPSPNAGHVFVPDYENHRIQKYDSNGTFIMEWGSGSESSLDAEFDNPHSVDVDLSGNVYV
jgi:DNA-binding beta-propeller fold protein YncE